MNNKRMGKTTHQDRTTIGQELKDLLAISNVYTNFPKHVKYRGRNMICSNTYCLKAELIST